MKRVSVSEARSHLEAVLDSAQKERVVVTRGGKPSAVIVGVEAYDATDFALANSPAFWTLIEQRRKGRSISLVELKRRLKARERNQTTKPGNGGRKAPGRARRAQP